MRTQLPPHDQEPELDPQHDRGHTGAMVIIALQLSRALVSNIYVHPTGRSLAEGNCTVKS